MALLEVCDEEDSEGGIHAGVQARSVAASAWRRASAEDCAGDRRSGAIYSQLGQGPAEGKLGSVGKGKPITPEQMEISRLRAENVRLKMEMEIVKKAAAYFAKESL
jgi:transposase-like protein